MGSKCFSIVREYENDLFSKILIKKKTAFRNIFNKYTYLLKYIKEKDTLCKKSHLEEKQY